MASGLANGLLIHININQNRNTTFLIDTGASICTLKSKAVNNNKLNRNDITTIAGIAGQLETLGTGINTLHMGDHLIDFKFHVVADNFPVPVDGIIGADFLKQHEAKIDLETSRLQVKIENKYVNIPITGQENQEILLIPKRCESTYWITSKHNTDRVFERTELCEGVFMSGSISRAKNGKIPIKILNTRENDVSIKWTEPKSTKADDYYVLRFEKATRKPNERIEELLKELKYDTMNPEEVENIKNICEKFQDIFHLNGDKLTVTNVCNAKVQLQNNAVPKYTKPYRIPHSQKVDIQNEVAKMLEDDIVEPSVSAWNSPVLVVPKKKDPVTGLQKFRMVIDYRRVNDEIEDDKFPLPNITDIYDMLGNANYFSCIDLSQGYYQMELDKNSRPCTAFSTENGHYQMKRLPMGLKISPSIFSRMMTIAMSGLTYNKCFVYLDDLIIFGRSMEDHNKNLMEVFQRFREVNLKIHPGKCAFLRKEVLYLGHIISDKGIRPDPEKSKVMENFPVPKNADEVRRFVAFANYYRKFIPDFASITIPLNRLLKKDVTFTFNDDCVKAFNKIKNILVSPELLTFPDFEKEFILRTDASGFALGAILSNFDDRPIAYASKTLNNAEKNYSTIEKELLAIVWAVKHYRPYLFGRRFKILTDHRPLVYLFSLKEPSSRLTKFRLLLEEYSFYVEYSPGKDNCTADALSRITMSSNDLKTLFIGVTTRSQSKKKNNITDSTEIPDTKQLPTVQEILKPPKTGEKIIELRIIDNMEHEINEIKGQDIVLGPNRVLAYVPGRNYIIMVKPTDSTTACLTSFGKMLLKDVQSICGPMEIKNLFIFKREIMKLSVGRPKSNLNNKKILKELFEGGNISIKILENQSKVEDPAMKRLILNDDHILPTSGHAGINRMMSNMKRRYFWTGMQNDIATYVKHCGKCQRNKHTNTRRQPMTISTTGQTSFEKIFVDLVGPLQETERGNKYILTIQDELTKFTENIPLQNKEAETVAKGFTEQFILRHGIPKRIASDQGTEFMNQVFKTICKTLKIEQMFSTAYHHESIGALENSHKVLGAYLRTYCTDRHTDWDEWIPFYTFSYNTAVHSETEYTPLELVYGRRCILPSNIAEQVDAVYNYEDYAIEMKNKLQIAHRDAREILIKKKEERKTRYDNTYKTKDYDYDKGDLVVVKNENRKKLDEIYVGPYEVVASKGVNCEINKDGKRITIHKNRLKPFRTI